MDIKKPLYQSHWPSYQDSHVTDPKNIMQQRSEGIWFNPKQGYKKIDPSFDELNRSDVQWAKGSEGWSSNSSSSGSFSQSFEDDTANMIQWSSGSEAWNAGNSVEMRGTMFNPFSNGGNNMQSNGGWNSMMSPIPTTSYVPTVPLEFPKDKSKVKEIKLDRTFQNNILLPEVASSNVEEELSKQDLYKTEMCKSWTESNTCRYGEKCQFAHGESELRPVFRHPKYKTEICKTFHNYGNCNYGRRCRFVHISPSEITLEEEEVLPPKPQEVLPKPQEVLPKPQEVLPPKPLPQITQPPLQEKNKKDKGGGSKLPFFQKLHKQNKKKVN